MDDRGNLTGRSAPHSAEVVLRLRHVSVARTDGKAGYAIEDVSLDCAAGTWTVLTGPPGAGKTAVLRCAVGLDPVATGKVTVDRRARRAYLSRRPAAATAAQGGTLATAIAGRAAPAATLLGEMLRYLGLWDARTLPITELSLGEQRAAALALALADGPRLLIADGPVTELGPDRATAMLRLIRHRVQADRLCVLMAADDLLSVSQADTVILLADGRVAGRETLPPGVIAPR